jgi:LysM repeat protein
MLKLFAISKHFCSMKKAGLIVHFILGVVAFVSGQEKMSTMQYIETYASIAVREMEVYQIPASIKMAQGILESSSGNSPLAREAKNHFGIKCKKDWSGETYIQDDDEKNECFRKYETVLASYEDHSQFLKKGQRYASLFTLERNDYKGWAHGLKAAGYATNPQYAPLLIKTIEENRLFELDKPGRGPEFKQPEKETPQPKQTIAPLTEKPVKSKKSVGADLPDFELRRHGKYGIRERNGVEYVLAQRGDTYDQIAKELDLMGWQLPQYNEAEKTRKLREGEIVYLQPKRRKAEDESYTVQKNESLWDVSQFFAVKVSRLAKLNELSEDSRLKPGQTIKLR